MKTLLSTLLVFISTAGLLTAADKPARLLTYEKDDAVYVAHIDGSSPKKISRGQSPDLSPDGTLLAYNTLQPEGQTAFRQIAVTDLASGKTTILKDIPSHNCMEAHWSPDSKQILFEFYANNERRLGLVNADGTSFHDLQGAEDKHKDYWSETWAADGKSIYAQDMQSLYQLDLDAKVLKKWVIEKLIPHGGMSGDTRLDASPDGKYLLMEVEMDEKERKGWDGPPSSIWKLELATEKPTRLTSKSLYGWDCHWLDAPDSILFVSQNQGEETASIYRMNANGEGKKLLVKNARGPGTSR